MNHEQHLSQRDEGTRLASLQDARADLAVEFRCSPSLSPSLTPRGRYY
jgi:hypothetical protein